MNTSYHADVPFLGLQTEKQFLNHVHALTNKIQQHYLELAQMLFLIKTMKLHGQFGCKSWRVFCTEKLQFSLRKADYLAEIWDFYAAIPVHLQPIADQLSWSNFRLLAHGIDPKGNDLHMWLNKAKNSTFRALDAALRAYLQPKTRRVSTAVQALIVELEMLHTKLNRIPTTADIVRAASSSSNELLKGKFTWNREEAAKNWRLHEAAMLIQSLGMWKEASGMPSQKRLRKYVEYADRA